MLKKIGIILLLLLTAQCAGRPQGAAPTILPGLVFAQLQENGQPCPPECVTDSMEIVTWYPSPYNEYEELRLYPKWMYSTCDDNSRGLMFYDDNNTLIGSDDKLMVCRGDEGWKELGGGSTYWALSGDDIYSTNNGDVHITGNLRVDKSVIYSLPANSVQMGYFPININGIEYYTQLYINGSAKLVNNTHQITDCINSAGTIYDIDSQQYICVFNQSSCPSGWSPYQSWTSTTSSYCASGNCMSGGGAPSCNPNPCGTGSHADFQNIAPETCSYHRCCACYSSGQVLCSTSELRTCTAGISKIGCI